ncbi:MAG: hypothetical protein EA416_01795, partial [Trueperaceae bacterium]
MRRPIGYVSGIGALLPTHATGSWQESGRGAACSLAGSRGRARSTLGYAATVTDSTTAMLNHLLSHRSIRAYRSDP